MPLETAVLEKENPFITLRNSSDLTQNFQFLSSNDLYINLPESTPLDLRLSHLFEEMFLAHEPKSGCRAIPKILHLIWIGPKEYPAASIPRLEHWLSLHPDWEFYFWTDSKDKTLPHKRAIRKIAYVLDPLQKYYKKSSNCGEMSDLIRISVLHDHGGVYFDHDLDCLRRFDSLTQSCDFLIACEFPGECGEFLYLDHSTLKAEKSSFSITNALIASAPFHPIWGFIINALIRDWDYFTHHPRLTDHQKTMHRTYLPFTRGIIDFDPRSHSSFALMPSLFHAPVRAIRLGEEIFQKIEGWIFAANYYEGLWK